MDGTKVYAGLFVGLFLVIVGFWLVNQSADNTPYVQIGDNQIKVELAETPKQQSQGLSGRQSLGNDEGMLFMYEQPGFQHFWMKDMNFPIDIIWIGGDEVIVGITENLTPDTYPETFSSVEPSQYVLEVNAGYTQEHGISQGDIVTIRLK